MDCEKFDQHVIDALYDELDELTYAALKRHVEGCSRCAGVFSSLRATRDVGVLPLEEPSEELEARILDAVTTAQQKTPLRRKILRGLAWAGSHAMRPQLAMAALFFLVIGSSLLLLRAKPGTVGAPVRVTENGAPAPENDDAPAATAMPVPVAQATPAQPAAEAAEGAKEPRQAMAEPKALDDSAKASKDKEASKADKDAARAALADARAVRDSAGCSAAVSKYDEVGTRFAETGAAADAMWEAAACYKSMGDTGKARELYTALKSFSSYRERAAQELAVELNVQNNVAIGGALASKAAAAPAPAAAPPPATVADQAAEPAKSKKANEAGNFGGTGKVYAAPKRAASPQVDQKAVGY